LKNLNRLKFLRIAVCLGLLVGIVFSHELWFPIVRTFPRVPLVFASPILIDQLLTIILIISLIFFVASLRPKVFFTIAITSLILLIFFDQMRLQPWVYQYFLLLLIIALQTENDSNQTLCLSQIIIAGLYFWSGIQKMNFTFSHGTLPMLLTPVQNLFPEIQLPIFAIGLSVAILESLVGLGLIFRKTRNIAIVLAVGMHVIILCLLIAKSYNSIVWLWNVFMILLVIIAFWRSDALIRQVTNWSFTLAKSVVSASVFLPILSFVGLWDMYLSGALYSGNTAVAVIRIDNYLYEKLPPNAKQSVFYSAKMESQILPLHEWSMLELNVPVYPEKRVFEQITNEICKLTSNHEQVELIIKERPKILDGKYEITRTNCDNFSK
jgi:hypothetical protein